MRRAVESRCYVLFSGGRDSSVILAVATAVARSIGAPDPIPVTAVYPGDSGADESEWQELVLHHLGITNRVVIPITDQRRILGPLSQRHLRSRGLVWPIATHSQPAIYESLGPGSLLTGEGGDGIIAGRRVTPLLILKRTRTLPSRSLLRAVLESVEPRVVHRARNRRRSNDGQLPWLLPSGRDYMLNATVNVRPPLRWDTETWEMLGLRHVHMAMHNLTVGASEHSFEMSHPLADPLFVAALAHQGGRWGFRGRTDVFRHLAGDLLPEAILARTTKAYFNASRWGDDEREFAVQWDGSGVDASFVDPAALRAEWLSERPHPASHLLAHVAWLHQEGISWDGASS